MKYYENACQTIEFGKLASFSILTDHKNYFSRLENNQNVFHTFPDSVGILLQQSIDNKRNEVRQHRHFRTSLPGCCPCP